MKGLSAYQHQKPGTVYPTTLDWKPAQTALTLYKAVACILPLKGTVTETGGGSYIATIDK